MSINQSQIIAYPRQALNDELWKICEEAQKPVQALSAEIEAMLSEKTMMAVDLQGLVPPVQHLLMLWGRDRFWQPICQWLFSWKQWFLSHTSNEMIETQSVLCIQDFSESLTLLVSIAVQEKSWILWPENYLQPGVAEKKESKNAQLLSIFYEEADELLIALQESLSQANTQEDQSDLQAALKRDLHTLKGAAKTVGFKELADIIHELENITTALSDQKLQWNEAIHRILQEGVDFIASSVEALKSGTPMPAVASLMSGIQKATQIPVKEKKKTKPVSVEPKATLVTESAQASNVVRVPVTQLDQFSALASVANVSRVNLEEEMQQMGRYVNAVVDTLGHLKAQFSTLGATDSFIHLENLGLEAKSTLDHMDNWLLQQQQATEPLQEGLTGIRMEPFSTRVPRLERLVRQVSQETAKKVNFVIEGEHRACDRKILDHLIPSIEHMLRNAIDHGIESSQERQQQGKNEAGQLTLSIQQTGSELIVTLQDDGRGIDTQKVRKKAESLGWVQPTEILTEESLFQFILKPGFSTSEKVTEISGRGVGMDVVSNEVAHLGGVFNIRSILHQGATFEIIIPFTLSLNRVLLFEVQHEWYGIQLVNIEGIVRLSADTCQRCWLDKVPFMYANQAYDLIYLAPYLGLPKELENHDIFPVLLVHFENKRVAFLVDQLIGTKEVVIQSVGPQLKMFQHLNGAAILSDGKVVFVLDPAALYHLGSQQKKPPVSPILVVDDSLTVRDSLGAFLKKNQYSVTFAEDGQEAIEQLEKINPQLVLLDLDMPRRNGFDVIRHMKSTPFLKNIPIIVITSEESERAKVLSLGANDFMVKPFEEEPLLMLIEHFCGKTGEKNV